MALFQKHPNVKAVFHGHDHDQDNVKEHKGKHYFFDSHIGGSWGTDYRGYRVVEVLKDGSVISYQMNPAAIRMGEKVVNKNSWHIPFTLKFPDALFVCNCCPQAGPVLLQTLHLLSTP
jgi:hypothetical protein